MINAQLNIKSDANGVGAGVTTQLSGFLEEIIYTMPASGGFANSVVISVTAVRTGVVLWTQTLSTNASKLLFPRFPTNTAANAALLYAAGGTPVSDKYALADDAIRVSVSAAGSGNTGSFEFVLSDEK